jgi:hypothetical protein
VRACVPFAEHTGSATRKERAKAKKAAEQLSISEKKPFSGTKRAHRNEEAGRLPQGFKGFAGINHSDHGLAGLEIGPVAGGLSHKKDGIKQRKFKGPSRGLTSLIQGALGITKCEDPFPRALGSWQRRGRQMPSHSPPRAPSWPFVKDQARSRSAKQGVKYNFFLASTCGAGG